MTEEKNSNSSNPNNTPSSSATNIFLNVSIALLAIIVGILIYSFVNKISQDKKKTELSTNAGHADSIIQLEVLNGCGKEGIADKVTDYLRKNNFDVVQIGNYRSFDMDKTLIIDRVGKKANALKLAEVLGVDEKYIIQQKNDDYLLDITLVIGKDFNHIKPFVK